MLTEKQAKVLAAIDEKPLTCHLISQHLSMTTGEYWDYDRVHSILRRLEDSSLVRRTYPDSNIANWELTMQGRRELDKS